MKSKTEKIAHKSRIITPFHSFKFFFFFSLFATSVIPLRGNESDKLLLSGQLFSTNRSETMRFNAILYCSPMSPIRYIQFEFNYFVYVLITASISQDQGVSKVLQQPTSEAMCARRYVIRKKFVTVNESLRLL